MGLFWLPVLGLPSFMYLLCFLGVIRCLRQPLSAILHNVVDLATEIALGLCSSCAGQERDGSLRLCVNYKQFNSASMMPMPRIDDLII